MLGALLSGTCAERPDHPAIAHEETTLTFTELAAAADRLAVALGVSAGERVAVVAPNVPALVIGLFATWRVGAVAIPLNARLRGFELGRALADATPAAAVCLTAHGGFELADEIAAIGERSPGLRTIIVVDELGAVVQTSPSGGRDRPARSAEELAAILYTSGTTGEPKGALMPHALADAQARNLAALLGDDSDAAFVLAAPASHAFGLGCLLCGIAAGATAVLIDVTASLDPLMRAVHRYHPLVLHGVPALLARVLRSGSALPIRSGLVAGSWCPPDVLAALDQRGIRMLNLYGMTEIGAATSCRRNDPSETRYRTVGRPLPGYEVRIFDDEIQVRGDHLPSGYHGRPWGEAELAERSWFRTGDLGALDAAGNLEIAGRAKEVVHVGGFNVFPTEVESFLLTHPAIAQAAVIGVPHPVLGEALQAFVEPAGEQSLAPREVIRFARAGIAGYKVPYAVRVLDELPLLPSGKPDRHELADRARRAAVVG